MRVITGSARGRRLGELKGMETRPTTDKVKESIFNCIQFDVADARVLDLFAGTGQLGIEALSRGARSALFVDRRADAVKLIRENLALCRLECAGRLRRFHRRARRAERPVRHHPPRPALRQRPFAAGDGEDRLV